MEYHGLLVLFTVKLLHIYISPEHNYFGHHGKPPGEAPMIEVDEVECVAEKGLVGDRFFGWKEDYKGQVTFFAHEVYERLCEQFQIMGVPPSIFRRNIITKGVDLNTLIGQEFEVQGVRFLGMCECSPCYWMDQAFAEGAEAAMKNNGGLRAKVLSTGALSKES
ncbi:molybdenum cofactor sulfurase [Brevifollis gellanilyticus]|uniref:Molybdenum cofactor sulfurase n=1 Tax=Brevifollis gellanilyticus TaxID=748831 RepID=A0A512MG56_9BACT|nr:molybdenum cofactor sulfurase [Brevifollis gellanilyticus]